MITSQSRNKELHEVPKEAVPDGETGPALIGAIAANDSNFNLDLVLDRSPFSNPPSDDELMRLIRVLRAERTQIDLKQEKRKEKKEGVNDEIPVT